MGPAATVDFFRRVVALTDAATDQDHLRILIDNRPGVPDRTAYLLGHGSDPTPTLVEMAQGLERAGADLLVVACNTANAFVEEVSAGVSIPIVRWADEVGSWIIDRRPTWRRIAVLASTGTIRSGLYQKAFARSGLEVLVPSAPDQDELMAAIYLGVKGGAADVGGLADSVRRVSRSMRDRGADATLLACTELSWIAANDPSGELLGDCYLDAAQIVAEQVVTLSGANVIAEIYESRG
jgi:aspartate racemase